MPGYITATASVTDVDLVIGYNASSNGTQCETGVQHRLFVESSVICPGFHKLRYVEWEDSFDGGKSQQARCGVRTVGAGFKPALTVLCARMRGTSDTVCWVSAARSSLECPCRQNDVEAGRQECPPHLQASFLRVLAQCWKRCLDRQEGSRRMAHGLDPSLQKVTAQTYLAICRCISTNCEAGSRFFGPETQGIGGAWCG